jgi:hypothetical protein
LGRSGRRLTFELSWHQRWDARARLAKMYRVPPTGPAWPAVGAQLERGVRLHSAVDGVGIHVGGATKPCSKVATFSGMIAHGSFDCAHICLLIVNQFGSSKVPAAIVRMPGRTSAVCEIVVPHVGQKLIRNHRPLSSERCSISDTSPCSTSTASSLKDARIAKALASRFWQNRQWHTVPAAGLPWTRYRRAPQAQPPRWTSVTETPGLEKSCACSVRPNVRVKLRGAAGRQAREVHHAPGRLAGLVACRDVSA